MTTCPDNPSWPSPAPLIPDEVGWQHLPIAVGDTVVANDGAIGPVEQILRSESGEPMFVVVAVRTRLRRRHPVLPFELVKRVDRHLERVYARGPRASIKGLPEALPLLV